MRKQTLQTLVIAEYVIKKHSKNQLTVKKQNTSPYTSDFTVMFDSQTSLTKMNAWDWNHYEEQMVLAICLCNY